MFKRNNNPEDTLSAFQREASAAQLTLSFVQTLDAAASLFILQNIPSRGPYEHHAHHSVAKRIVSVYGPTTVAIECMLATLESIEVKALTPSFSVCDAHIAIWRLMEKHLKAGTDFPWTPEQHKVAAFQALIHKVEQSAKIGNA